MKTETQKMEMTAKQAMIVAEFIADYNGGESTDYLDGDTEVLDTDLTRNHEFEQFDGRHWNSHENREYSDQGGYRAAHYDNVQAIKGQTRKTLWVVDFSDFRAVTTF